MAAGKARPWWWSPGPVAFGLVMLAASAAVLLEDRIVPPKKVDIRDRVTSAGGATFCDTVPLPPGQRADSSAQPPAALPVAPSARTGIRP